MFLVIAMNKLYFCIDLKTFYASVECIERGLDPFKTDLIVADPSRCNGAICLAISPKMKKRGIKNRCRVYEIPKNIKPIVAKPRMRKYMEYSAKVYSIYLKYISKNDIHVYSIDEAFLDVTTYLKLYNNKPLTLAKKILNDIYNTTGITATVGIGTNLYLAKIALDIIAKHSNTLIGFLNEELYKEKLWHYQPLTDFWQINIGTLNRLKKHHLKDMYDIAHCNPNILYKEFGIKAEYLIDHANGIEPCTIKDIKNYKPKSNSISNSQILYEDYDYKKARIVLIEMLDTLLTRLIVKNLYTKNVSIYIGYSKDIIPALKYSINLKESTNNYTYLLKLIKEEYDYRINEEFPIRRIGLSFNKLEEKKYEQLNIFSNVERELKEKEINIIMSDIKNKFGKNSILRAISLSPGATARERNKLIGGHNAE